ncbi:MAG: hypothetical protein UR89_C0035G0002 [Candidatus Roizmanbacteria bacterium GW2011_GWA2_35_8]|uniref:Nucleotidyltransferase n=1 Tax=Candidatus Roizmanbacteria bacterium GW2011_GWA2_35_8 TaxID=1618479 RepID=A0A0G0CYC0_9BACT|nr:MAG: hypothetical protein UR89_C0035G0002 [Candidatus Roizmanbacteria bacterium GW2011_GWA2_35_8]
MKRTNFLFLSDILKSINYIEKFTKGFTMEKFLEAEMEQFAVIRNLEVIGEAARNIDEEFKKSHILIPWRSINGFRNILVHEYFDVDMEAVWNVIIKELPSLKKEVEEALLTENKL